VLGGVAARRMEMPMKGAMEMLQKMMEMEMETKLEAKKETRMKRPLCLGLQYARVAAVWPTASARKGLIGGERAQARTGVLDLAALEIAIQAADGVR